ncbi:cadmium resistance transporter [Rhodococcus sp. ADH]|uniref:cadmium resistance transporter n=2 Tax=Mycobacteriales TaxID=85007 RepID=UPI00068EC0F5|nr:cadmium resistance transporter [Rhodococcus sp. ADH]RGP48013.1 hypothetical protein AWH04_16620 [Rhodococcus erythropolis]
MLDAVVAAAVLFVGTNIDALVTGTMLTAAACMGRSADIARIWGGQLIGLVILTGVSMFMATGLRVLPPVVFAIIGLVPLGLGIKRMVSAIWSAPDGSFQAREPVGFGGCVVLALVSGGDNLAAYSVSFQGFSTSRIVVTLCVFVAGALLWSVVGTIAASRPVVLQTLSRVERWLVPILFMVVGILAITRALTIVTR